MFAKKIKSLGNVFLSEVKSHPAYCILLTVILLLAFFVRTYRADQLLRFYFDQGRDALVIWKFLHEGDFFFVGPVTGLAGIFLGPLYYYLIAPFYWIGGGDPVVPSYFLAFLGTLAIAVLYYLGWKMGGRATGLIAALIASISYYLVLAGRWLSNPTPILLTSVLLLWAMWEIGNGKSKLFTKSQLWIVVALLVGVSLQFESASAVFYIPMIIVFSLWQWKSFPDKKTFAIATLTFFATLLPQIAFNLKNDNLLTDNFKKIILDQQSFKVNFWDVFDTRLKFFWDVFSSKILPGKQRFIPELTLLSFFALIYKVEIRKKTLPFFAIFLGIPAIGYLFFQGNHGNIYDYYLTGYYLPMILLFSIGLGIVWEHFLGKVILIFSLALFLNQNAVLVKNYITSGVDGPTNITLGNQKQAVNWVYDDAKAYGEFNVDVYVPPVIPHAYDYLFLWIGTKRCGVSLCNNVTDTRQIVYTLYEVDPPHPERLENWLARYETTSEIEASVSFGGITVERRRRL